MTVTQRKPLGVQHGQAFPLATRARRQPQPRVCGGGETHLQRLERLRHGAETLRQAMVRLGDTILARVPNEGLSDDQLTTLDARLASAALQLRVLEHALLALDNTNEGCATPL